MQVIFNKFSPSEQRSHFIIAFSTTLSFLFVQHTAPKMQEMLASQYIC